MKRNFKRDIECAASAGGGPIIKILIGSYEGFDHDQGYPNPVPADKVGKLLNWEEAAPWLDYDYEGGFGKGGCHPIVAWTRLLIIYTTEYDGRHRLVCKPRKPVAYEPTHN